MSTHIEAKPGEMTPDILLQEYAKSEVYSGKFPGYSRSIQTIRRGRPAARHAL